MRRFVNDEILKNKSGEDLVSIDVRKEAVNAKNVDVGSSVKKLLSQLPSNLKIEFLADAKEFYATVTTYLLEKLPLKNKLLQSLAILHPLLRKESGKSTLPSVRPLANMLPHVINEEDVDRLADEWILYINDDEIKEDWSIDQTGKYQPIDFYWNKIFSMVDNTNAQKYKYLSILVKAVLSFSHGQASIERGFSVNKRMVTSERSSLSIDTIRDLRFMKDAVKGKKINITLEMMKFYKEAYSKYKAQKEMEKQKGEEKKKEKQEQTLTVTKTNKMDELKANISSAQFMIEEGNKRLVMGLKRKSMTDIEAAHALIDAGNKKLKKANEEAL